MFIVRPNVFLTKVRRHNDIPLYDWAITLLTELKKKGKIFTAHYLGYGQFTLEQLEQNALEKNEDLFSNSGTTIVFCFDYTLEETRRNILQEVEKNKNIKLLWVGAEKDPFDHPRIKNIFWPADMLLQNKEYKKFDNIEKEPSSKTHWISTSLGIRPHRVYMASLLMGLGLNKHGDLRIKTVSSSGKKSPLVSTALAAGNNNAPDNIQTLPMYIKDKWKLSTEIENVSPESNVGYQRLIERKWWGSSLFLYTDYLKLGWNQNNNAVNFDKNLRQLYKDKTLEVVNETSHTYDPVFVTEKFINAVIGLNLVIMNGPAGTVKLLEDLGWNSCRHVVNHDYDDITDPILRCEQAIRLNSKLFSDTAYCNDIWQENLTILKDNSEWAREHLYANISKKCKGQVEEFA